MSEKRFKYIMFDGFEDNGEYLNPQEVVKILNELYEENQSSKEFIEQLQKELVLFKKAGADMGSDLNAQITALKEENEQLKEENCELLKDNKRMVDFIKTKGYTLKDYLKWIRETWDD